MVHIEANILEILTPRRAADDHQSDHRDDIFKCAIAQQIDTLSKRYCSFDMPISVL